MKTLILAVWSFFPLWAAASDSFYKEEGVAFEVRRDLVVPAEGLPIRNFLGRAGCGFVVSNFGEAVTLPAGTRIPGTAYYWDRYVQEDMVGRRTTKTGVQFVPSLQRSPLRFLAICQGAGVSGVPSLREFLRRAAGTFVIRRRP